MHFYYIWELKFYQQKWNKIFIELGVDIILGDHPHAVQPIEFVNDNKTIIVNYSGNFANSYIKHDGILLQLLIYILIKIQKN